MREFLRFSVSILTEREEFHVLNLTNVTGMFSRTLTKDLMASMASMACTLLPKNVTSS